MIKTKNLIKIYSFLKLLLINYPFRVELSKQDIGVQSHENQSIN